MPLPRRTRRRALTASAVRLTPSESDYLKRLNQPWQDRAFYYYDNVGELRFACQSIARQMSRVRFYPALLSDDGKVTEITEGPPVEALARIRDPGGGRSQLQYEYGRLMIVTGEGVLFGYRLETVDERWKFLWRDEVKSRDDGTMVRLDAQRKETSDVGIGYRMWTPHPRHSDEADSPVRAIQDIAEELILLTGAVGATARSRMSAGILAFMQGLAPSPLDAGEDEDPERHPFLKDMIEAMTASIEKPGDPANRMPFLWEMPLPAGERIPDVIQHIKLHDPATDYMEREMRIEAIKRMGYGMELPLEDITSMSDANHWTARQVMWDRWRSYGVIKALQFAADTNDMYLRPALREMGYARAEEVVIGMDDSQVVIAPDQGEIALKAHAAGAIGNKTLRRDLGYHDDDAQGSDEHDEWLAIKLRESLLLPDEAGIAPPARGPAPSPNGQPRAEEGPAAPTGTREGSRQESRVASILGAAELALRQCRARAGNRLRSHQHECEECKEKTHGAPNSIVASLLGPDQVQAFGLDPLSLVAGGTGEFRGVLVEWGIAHEQAAALCQRLEHYAAQTLFTERQPELPPGFMAQVAQAEEVSGALALGAT